MNSDSRRVSNSNDSQQLELAGIWMCCLVYRKVQLFADTLREPHIYDSELGGIHGGFVLEFIFAWPEDICLVNTYHGCKSSDIM